MTDHDTWSWGCKVPQSERANGDALDAYATCPVCEPTEAADSGDRELDDCPACDTPLSQCRSDDACCEDCPHAANRPAPESSDSVTGVNRG